MKKIFLIANLALAVSLGTVLYRQSINEREQALEAAYNDLEFIAVALQEHAQQTFAAIDLNLTVIAAQGYRLGLTDSAAIAALEQIAVNRQAATTNTYAFYVLDADGNLLASSDPGLPQTLNQSQSPQFIHHQMQPPDPDALLSPIHIGLPQIGEFGAADGNWVIPVSRRIPTADGTFAGVAVTLLALQNLQQFYDAMCPDGDSAVGLLSAHGMVLTRSPFDEGLLGAGISQISRFQPLPDAFETGRIIDRTLNDVVRISAYRYVLNEQLIVYANTTEAAVLADWQQDLVSRAGMMLLILALFAGASFAAVIFSSRQRRWAEQTVEAQQKALAEVNAAKAQVESIFNSISDAVYSLDKNWCFVYLNAEAEKLLERSVADLLGKSVWEQFPAARGTVIEEMYKKAANENLPIGFEIWFEPLRKWFTIRVYPHKDGLTVYFRDSTAHREMEDRLRQSQKMDALGQLTGGIAHDFNNLLTVILGNIDDVLEYLKDEPDHIRGQADVIRLAGERAAELTHRLLAFARKQPLNPRQTDVNQLIAEIKQLLRRTVSENIGIALIQNADWKAMVDPHELQNALLNLCLNARDAMPQGGKLTIETQNVEIDAEYAALNNFKPGHYLMIAVSDTGHGMAPDIVAKVFDPFYTTKTEGKGSGLGLSMVYGFALQSHGQVRIYSEPGEGTSVRLFLPRALGVEIPQYINRPATDTPAGGNERILLVEDDDLVRLYALTSLRNLGYQVVECSNGHEALEQLSKGEVFDLLFTDVVLAGGISGKQVAEEARKFLPDLKVLYMSGYTENAIVHHGRLDPGVDLLSKPFRLRNLADKIRSVLNRRILSESDA